MMKKRIMISIVSLVIVLMGIGLFHVYDRAYSRNYTLKDYTFLSKRKYIGTTWHLDGLNLDFQVVTREEGEKVMKDEMDLLPEGTVATVGYMKIKNKNKPVYLTMGYGDTFSICSLVTLNNQSIWEDMWEDIWHTDNEPFIWELLRGSVQQKDNNTYQLTLENINMLDDEYPESKEWEQLIGKKLELRRVE